MWEQYGMKHSLTIAFDPLRETKTPPTPLSPAIHTGHFISQFANHNTSPSSFFLDHGVIFDALQFLRFFFFFLSCSVLLLILSRGAWGLNSH